MELKKTFNKNLLNKFKDWGKQWKKSLLTPFSKLSKTLHNRIKLHTTRIINFHNVFIHIKSRLQGDVKWPDRSTTGDVYENV